MEKRSTPSDSFILQASRIFSSGRKLYTSQEVWWCADCAQYLQSSGHLPLRPLMIEQRSTLSPIQASRMRSAPSHNSSRSQVRKKERSSSLVILRPSIISWAKVSGFILLSPPYVIKLYWNQKGTGSRLDGHVWQ